MDELYKDRLRNFRIALSDRNTQAELSEDLDVTPEYFSKLESGIKSPSMLLHMDICLKLNKPSDCFFKNNRNDIQMSEGLFDYLMGLDKSQLKKILSVLQAIYDNENSNSI